MGNLLFSYAGSITWWTLEQQPDYTYLLVFMDNNLLTEGISNTPNKKSTRKPQFLSVSSFWSTMAFDATQRRQLLSVVLVKPLLDHGRQPSVAIGRRKELVALSGPAG